MTTLLPATIDTPPTDDIIAPAARLPTEAEPVAETAHPSVSETEPEKPLVPKFVVPKKRPSWTPTSISAIGFSLTFVLVSFALLVGVLPPTVAALPGPVDLGVLLLMVPLCALTLAMMVEVLRAAFSGSPQKRTRTVTALSDWRPGHGEG
jgi:hypothetical protein